MVSDLSEVATAIKTKFLVNEDKKEERQQLVAGRKAAEAGAVVPMASTELRMAMNFFMVSLLGFFHGSTSAAWEERTTSRFIPKKNRLFSDI